jgi:hypothetical protein
MINTSELRHLWANSERIFCADDLPLLNSVTSNSNFALKKFTLIRGTSGNPLTWR